MWPSEGSVSTDTLKVLSTCGVKWAATDEKMLHAVLGSGHDHVAASCTPWLLGDTALFFRNSMLSDLIGFVYSRWEPETAARHFVQELGKVADASGSADPVVTIAMDGENAWEYYVHGGMRFVDALYRAITADGRFRMVSPLEVLEEAGSLPHLDRVQAGSWIDGTFRTWIGDPVKNTAWEHLLSARNAVASHLKKNNVPDAERAQLQDLMMRAEASDWFWWYGKGHSSPYDAEFDELYRDHLQAIYEKLRMRPPEALSEPLDPENRDPVACRPPVHLISPAITGREDGYYKWLSSGVVEAQEGFSHRPDVTLQELRFGFDLDRLYLKVTGSAAMRQLMEERRMSVELHFVLPEQRSYAVSLGDDGQTRVEGGEHSRDRRGIDAAVGSVLEMAIPLRRLGVEAGADDGRDVVEMYLVVVRKGREVERFPHSSSVVFTVRGEDLDAENWHV
jgi:alpha-amylase/alpha-mannosidase (GH57 family)